ncbi:MAG: hypothetical protein K6A36_02330 [Paludibacteraceae bacterium]|nr:hypothetical protein [Paludibacteraceae bacterium]
MMKRHRYIASMLGVLLALSSQAERWDTYFAYNNVTQIALTPDRVFAISDGSLYSVDKQTEQIRIYNNQSGLHGTGINCIGYDERSQRLLIAYKNGKIDMLSANGVQYVGDLYDKDMTQRKTIYNITIEGRTAYLSTHYGVQTFDLRENKLVDSYWLRPKGEETPIADVLIANDSIYAFSIDSLYCAALRDNLVDYRVWKRELRGSRIAPDGEKGTHYTDSNDEWYAGGADGIVRFSLGTKITYKPQGPLSNNPYSLTAVQDKLWVVPGGRWASQNGTQGLIMRYDGKQWTNITSESIRTALGNNPVLDFMNVAVDPRNSEHYFVTSYGCGLFEFNGNEAVRQYLPADDNPIGSAVVNEPKYYTRLDNAMFDQDNRLWFMNGGSVANQLLCLDAANHWHGLPLQIDGEHYRVETPGGLLVDNHNPNYKWMTPARRTACVILMDDRGTPFDTSDDRVCKRKDFVDQNGLLFSPDEMRAMMQAKDGRVWLGTDQGIAIVEASEFFDSERINRPCLMDGNGEFPLSDKRVMAICQDSLDRIWVGTQTMGIYVISADAKEILQQYTTDNSAMPSNSVLSLACDGRGVVYVGTAEGLVSYNHDGTPDGLRDDDAADKEDLDEGSLQQWRLHFSYSQPQIVVASPGRIYALADGALFSVDRETEEMEYWNKTTGLNGGSISHIDYDEASSQLIISYDDGRIDLLHENGTVRSMPDLYMKASSMAITVNDITVGSRYVYLAMPFGVLALNAAKAEVADTYYVGEEAAAVDIKQVVEQGDSLFVFTPDFIYSASLQDNLVDYTYWHKVAMPKEGLQQAFVYQDELYVLADNLLYRRREGVWQKVSDSKISYARSSGGKLLARRLDEAGLWTMSAEGEINAVTVNYSPTDAVRVRNDYWMTVEGHGLVRYNGQETTHYQPEGPSSNMSYHVHAASGHIYMLPGGRWASEWGRIASLSIYDGTEWRNIPRSDIWNVGSIYDPVSIAVDPNDAGHFYVSTYGCGVVEFHNYVATARYNKENSTLMEVLSGMDPKHFTRTDGATWDEQGNMWVLNATEIGSPIHVLTPNGTWHALQPTGLDRQPLLFNTPRGILIDRRNSRYKWMIDQRVSPGVILLDDGGTPTYPADDIYKKRTKFAFHTEKDGVKVVDLTGGLYCLSQDQRNRVWIGTNAGIVIIPASTNFFSTDTCHLIVIPRNDGTGLGDYLLGDEQINCIENDGGNRMWIGTASSGLYLIEDDTLTVAHFTAENSRLPSNNILSIAIQPTTGEVFVGTDKGLASYRSDAAEPQEDFSKAYAFPNPVRPDYVGTIGIAGLMAETMVNIVDESGNLVCKTRSHGGMAVWDGKLPDGRRATPGIYTALCNEPGGKHSVVKILIIR